MPDITYHLATPEEVKSFHVFFRETINQLFSEYSKETREYFVEKDYDEWWINKSVSDKSKYIYLAMHDKEIVGYILFGKVYGGVSMASWIAVSPLFQNKGIGKELMKLWEDWALENGAHSLQLWTQDKNISYYEKLCFTLSGKFPHAWFGATTNLLYKTLKIVNAGEFIPKS